MFNFSGIVNVHIQGTGMALEIEDPEQDITVSTVTFSVIGVPEVTIHDHRPAVLDAIKDAILTQDFSPVASALQGPADIDAIETEDGGIVVDIRKTTVSVDADIKHALYIAANVPAETEFPYYDFLYYLLYRLDDGSYSLFFLYRRPVKAVAE